VSRATESNFDDLHLLVAEAMIEQIKAWKAGRLVDIGKEGEYVKVFPPALLAQAIKFLKDNGVDAPAQAGNRTDRLAGLLREFNEDDHASAH